MQATCGWLRAVVTPLLMTAATLAPAALLAWDAPLAPLDPRISTDQGVWTELAPPLRSGHVAVFDPVRHRMIIFGGIEGASARNEVWALSLSGAPEWSRIVPLGNPPAGRTEHIAIYDPVRDRIVVFGGQGDLNPFKDVWALTLSGPGSPAWTELTPGGTPPAQSASCSAIFDPVRDRMVLFGGGYSNEVWILPFGGAQDWTKLTPSGVPPRGRWEQTAVYDAARDRMLVCGGITNDSPSAYDSVSVLDFGPTPAWSTLSVTGTGPGSFWMFASAYDSVHDRLLILPGDRTVWALSLSGNPAWSSLTTSGAPHERMGHVAVYDPIDDRVILSGGVSRADYLDYLRTDTWSLSLASSPTWTRMVPVGDTPLPRSNHMLVYDPVRDRMIMFGGIIGFPMSYLTDTWSLSLTDPPQWSLVPVSSPFAGGGREWGVAIYDPIRDRILAFGGYRYPADYNDTWSLDLSGTGERAWAQLAPGGTPPSPREFCAAVYDPVRDRMLVFGGFDGVAQNDVWALQLSGAGGPAWVQLLPAGAPPPGRQEHVAIYDPVRDRMIVFGGRGDVSHTDTWSLSLAGDPTWTQLSTTGSAPGAGGDYHAFFDPVRDRMIVFGGWGGDMSARALRLAGTPEWTVLEPAGIPPQSRVWLSAAYDPVRDRLLMSGGLWHPQGPVSFWVPDVWALDFGADVRPQVACPGDVIWTKGSNQSIHYTLENRFSSPQRYDYELSSEREWPGLPIIGATTVAASATGDLALEVPIPDSAAVGLNLIRLRVALHDAPSLAGSCEHHLHDSSTPVLLSLVSAEADPNGVTLIWYSPDVSARAPAVERREDRTEWRRLGDAVVDGAGRITYRDAAVVPGRRYGYRLVFASGEEHFVGSETWLDVPRQPELALKGVRPNPAHDEVVIEFSLPVKDAARVELLDITGRRVWTYGPVMLEPGNHLVRVDNSITLRPGVYWVRLSQSGHSALARATLIR